MTKMILATAATLLFAASAYAQQAVSPAPAPAAGSGQTRTSLGARFDCLHDFNVDKGATQNCLAISGLRMTVTHESSPGVTGMLRLDPFTTPDTSHADMPIRDDLPTAADTDLGIVDAFALTWRPRPNLEVAAESYGGAARLPSVSGLSLANSLEDAGWRQIAMTVAYNLSVPTSMRVKFAAGNGEGETVKNLDPQQYFGFEADAAVTKGVRAVLGVSLDGNDTGSESYKYLWKRYAAECATAPAPINAKLGHSTQRLAAALVLDGTLPGAEGLKAALGWQRVTATDMDKKRPSRPTVDELAQDKCRLDPDTLFAEDPGESANTVERTTYSASVNYRLFSSYFVAADYSTRRLDTGSVKLFRTCSSFSGSDCTSPGGELHSSLTQDAWTAGGGMDLAPGLVLTFEYFHASYDKTYTQVYYTSQNGKPSNSLELFNARLAYDW